MHWELRFNTFDLIRCDSATLSTNAAIDAEARKPAITGVFIHVTGFAEKFQSRAFGIPANNMNNSEPF